MTPERRLESELPEILADLYLGPSPAYRESILGRTVGTRQRPAWTFLERWLPMEITLRSPSAAPVSWRPIAYAMLLLALALAIGIGAFIASRPRLPAPYGPAVNGQVVYATGGDIYLGDPATGTSRAIVSGPEVDGSPAFSRDGSRLVFLRSAGASSLQNLMVADVDGSDARVVTSVPLVGPTGGDWSGNGRHLIITSTIGGIGQAMSIIDVEAPSTRTLDVGMPVQEAVFQPPHGDAIAFISEKADGDGLYLVNADGSDIRPLVKTPRSKDLGLGAFSPDGSRIAYTIFDETGGRVHIINADGTGDIEFKHPAGVHWQGRPQWSPDGTELVVSRAGFRLGRPFGLAILPADGRGVGRDVGPPLTNDWVSWFWSPDGASVVVTFGPLEPGDPRRGALLIDAVDGTYRSLPYTEPWLVWQRVAP